MSKLWRFTNPWDYHQMGGFLVLAPTALGAARKLNAFLASDDSRDQAKHNYFPGSYDKPEKGTYDADDAEAVGPVYIEGGCDD